MSSEAELTASAYWWGRQGGGDLLAAAVWAVDDGWSGPVDEYGFRLIGRVGSIPPWADIHLIERKAT